MAVANGDPPDPPDPPEAYGGRPQRPVPRLPCGRPAARVWERAATGRLDAHERTCQYCQAVVTDQVLLARAARELTTDPQEPPPGLLERVMSMVRAELQHDYLPLPARHGPARVEHGPAASVLRHAVDQMAGVRARSCRISLADEQPNPRPHNDGGPAPGQPPGQPPGALVRLSVAVVFGADLLSVAARAQQIVLAAAEQLLGLPVEAVDVEVVDVFPPAGADGTAKESS